MKIAILKCRDCGKELNRSFPYNEKDEAKMIVTSGFAAGPCPEGCRTTFSDLNLNVTVEVIEDEDMRPL